MRQEHSRCLVLNLDYSPLSIISWQRALIWVSKYENNRNFGIDILDFFKDDSIVGVGGKKYPIPAVARTKRFFRIHNQRLIFSRKNIYIRDNYTCQYCGMKYDIKNLTYDHVIPKSKWTNHNQSPTTWSNIVTACVSCNRKKGSKTPKQANMVLKNLPCEPTKSIRFLPISAQLTKIEQIPDEWNIYLPEAYLI
jgi:hypothetical protein